MKTNRTRTGKREAIFIRKSNTELCHCEATSEYHTKDTTYKMHTKDRCFSEQIIRSADNVIFDLIEISKKPKANIELLLKDAFTRGLNTGKELAKRKAIEAIEQEK